MITNPSQIVYRISISRNERPMAVIDHFPDKLTVNAQWEIIEKRVNNRALVNNPNIRKSRCLNFEIGDGGRIDVRFENMDFASLLFNDRELYSVQFNADQALDGFDAFIDQECQRIPVDNDHVKDFFNKNANLKTEVVRKFIMDWMIADAANDDPADKIQRFIEDIGLARAHF